MSIDDLIRAHNAGEAAATSHLLELLYAELRRIASRLMSRERPGHTLQTTALVSEAYLRLVGGGSTEISDRKHFLCLAATTMRNILFDHARERDAIKRGGGAAHVTLDHSWLAAPEESMDTQALKEAIEALSKEYPRHVRVIDLRYFVGFSVEETADLLQVCEKTIKNDTQFAKAWLRRRLVA
ncbi:MAG TPA: ECF-type sigma factor [Candidatus Krumholzibacteria bacterium]|nr:ECF-type sigma factor [Candidatus Krumholzibacteria bacterium]